MRETAKDVSYVLAKYPKAALGHDDGGFWIEQGEVTALSSMVGTAIDAWADAKEHLYEKPTKSSSLRNSRRLSRNE